MSILYRERDRIYPDVPTARLFLLLVPRPMKQKAHCPDFFSPLFGIRNCGMLPKPLGFPQSEEEEEEEEEEESKKKEGRK